MESNGSVADRLELYRIKDGEWTLEMQTEVNLPWWKKVGKALGFYKCIDDALTNYAIQDFATYIHDKYGYASCGTDGTDGDVYTYTDLKTPVMTRVACTKAYATTYTTNDTVVYTAITTATSDYTLTEFGIHDALTSGNMGARQTSCTWDVVNGETFGMIWRIVVSRG